MKQIFFIFLVGLIICLINLSCEKCAECPEINNIEHCAHCDDIDYVRVSNALDFVRMAQESLEPLFLFIPKIIKSGSLLFYLRRPIRERNWKRLI